MRFALLLPSVALILAVPLSARGPTGEQAVSAAIGNRRPGPAAECIDPQQVRSTRIVAGIAILYDMAGRLYVQRPQAGAGSLRADDVLVSRIDSGQLCRLDTVGLVEPVTRMQRGFVVLGAFATYGPR